MQWPLPPTKKSHTGSPCLVEHFLHGAHLSTAYTPCNPDVCIPASSTLLLHGVPSTAFMYSCFRQTFRSGMSKLIGEWATNAASVRAEKYLATWQHGMRLFHLNHFGVPVSPLTGFVPPMTHNCCREISSYAAQIDFLLLNGLLCLHSSATSLSLGSAKY